MTGAVGEPLQNRQRGCGAGAMVQTPGEPRRKRLPLTVVTLHGRKMNMNVEVRLIVRQVREAVHRGGPAVARARAASRRLRLVRTRRPRHRSNGARAPKHNFRMPFLKETAKDMSMSKMIRPSLIPPPRLASRHAPPPIDRQPKSQPPHRPCRPSAHIGFPTKATGNEAFCLRRLPSPR